jgi:CheY-like chemotaxis protein
MANVKILVADDDPDMVESLKAILEGSSYDVVPASNREEAMSKINAERPDLAILDVMMSAWQDGFEMARELKQSPEFKDMPIILLTGVREKTGIDFKSSAGDAQWCPVDGYLDKPVEPAVLLGEIKKLLSAKP